MPLSRPAPTRIISVLFVCLGNICRSPMAESIFRHMVEQAGLSRIITVDSAGTGAWHIGEAAHIGTQRILRNNGLTTSHRARVVASKDFAQFDYVIALDRSNMRDLRSMAGISATRLSLLLDHAPQLNLADVPDPYFTGNFEETYQLVSQACRGLLKRVIVDNHITHLQKIK